MPSASALVHALSLVSAFALLGSSSAFAQTGSDAEAKALVRQLADTSFAKREAAAARLIEIGESAIPSLREATANDDAEWRRRIRQVTRAIARKARFSKSTNMEFTFIEEGEFQMGGANGEAPGPDEPRHRVTLSRGFLIGRREVTQEEYAKVTASQPSAFHAFGTSKEKVANLKTETFPIENVTWFDAIAFCNRLSEADGLPAYYKLTDEIKEKDSIRRAAVTVVGGKGYRLPTEAEWEYACRAGTETPYFYGVANNGTQANMRPTQIIAYGSGDLWKAPGRPVPVGSYPANSWGLFDTHGNVGEWCWDWYDKGTYGAQPRRDPIGPAEGTHRVVRGGSWIVLQHSCRSASRFFMIPSERTNHIGFRVARTF